MERFAINIDKSFKTNVFKICRLCGIDNPHKVAILEEVVSLLDGEDELPLYKKIFNCIGIQVSADDKMPKTICALCFDKINDFHEFREMCYSTNAQTRKLLGLQPQIEKKWNPNTLFNPIASEQLENLQKRNRKRRIDDIPPDIKFDKIIKIEHQPTLFMSGNSINNNKINAIKTEKDIILEKKGGKRSGPPLMMCNICQVNFYSNELLQSHLLKLHVPIIARYHCVQCNETIGNSLEIKNHNLWHRLSKTPFKCGRCDKKVISLQGLTRHMRECSKKVIRAVTIIPNIECKICSTEFQTKNLYYMHGCVTVRLRCPKCNCKMSNPTTTLKHIASCSVYIKDDIEDNFIIKNEPIDLPAPIPPPLLAPLSSTLDVKPSSVNNNPSMVVIPPLSSISDLQAKDNSKKNKKIKKDTEDAMRRCDELLKNTMKTLVSIKHEPAEDSVINVQSTSSESTTQSSLNTKSGQNLPAVRIKQEIIDEGYRDQIDPNIEINIKQELAEKVQPALKLKIKKEHGTLNASFIQNENCRSGDSGKEGPPINNKQNNVEVSTDTDILKSSNEELVVGELGSLLEAEKQLENPEIAEKAKKMASTLPLPIKIKQEIIDKENSDLEDELPVSNDDFHHGDYDSDDDNKSQKNEDTFDTTIPTISSVKSVVENKSPQKIDGNSNNKNIMIKPAMSQMLTISSISSAGNVIETSKNESKLNTSKSTENDLNKVKNSSETDKTEKAKESFIPQIISVSGGVDFISNEENQLKSSQQNSVSNFVMPQIMSVSSGVTVPSPSTDFEDIRKTDDDYNTNLNYIQIKKEKIDPGYNDHYTNEVNQNNDVDQQLLQFSDLNNTYQYDMNFVGAVRIKQEMMDIAEEGFGDEVQSECSGDDSDSENEVSNNVYDSNIEMQEFQNNTMMSALKDNDNMNSNSNNEENIESNSDNNGQTQNSTDLESNFSTNTNLDNNFKANSLNEYVNTNLTNKMPIISHVNSININDIYKIQNINSSNNYDYFDINYAESHKEPLNENNIENNSLNNNSNQNIESISTNLTNSINHLISGTPSSTSSTSSSSCNSLLEPALPVPEYKNINEIAENHNNENLEKLLRNEIIEQIPQTRPIVENVISNLVDNVEMQQEMDENILNIANNELNTINNSNIIVDNNIKLNTLPPSD